MSNTWMYTAFFVLITSLVLYEISKDVGVYARGSRGGSSFRSSGSFRSYRAPIRITHRIMPRITPRIMPRITPRIMPRITPRITPRIIPRITPRLTPRISPRIRVRMPVRHGFWSEWSGYRCEESCTRTDYRHCMSESCFGPMTRVVGCTGDMCFSQGVWSGTWSQWSVGPCAAQPQCGVGMRTKRRQCLSETCEGSSLTTENCDRPCDEGCYRIGHYLSCFNGGALYVHNATCQLSSTTDSCRLSSNNCTIDITDRVKTICQKSACHFSGMGVVDYTELAGCNEICVSYTCDTQDTTTKAYPSYYKTTKAYPYYYKTTNAYPSYYAGTGYRVISSLMLTLFLSVVYYTLA